MGDFRFKQSGGYTAQVDRIDLVGVQQRRWNDRSADSAGEDGREGAEASGRVGTERPIVKQENRGMIGRHCAQGEITYFMVTFSNTT